MVVEQHAALSRQGEEVAGQLSWVKLDTNLPQLFAKLQDISILLEEFLCFQGDLAVYSPSVEVERFISQSEGEKGQWNEDDGYDQQSGKGCRHLLRQFLVKKEMNRTKETD